MLKIWPQGFHIPTLPLHTLCNNSWQSFNSSFWLLIWEITVDTKHTSRHCGFKGRLFRCLTKDSNFCFYIIISGVCRSCELWVWQPLPYFSGAPTMFLAPDAAITLIFIKNSCSHSALMGQTWTIDIHWKRISTSQLFLNLTVWEDGGYIEQLGHDLRQKC